MAIDEQHVYSLVCSRVQRRVLENRALLAIFAACVLFILCLIAAGVLLVVLLLWQRTLGAHSKHSLTLLNSLKFEYCS